MRFSTYKKYAEGKIKFGNNESKDVPHSSRFFSNKDGRKPTWDLTDTAERSLGRGVQTCGHESVHYKAFRYIFLGYISLKLLVPGRVGRLIISVPIYDTGNFHRKWTSWPENREKYTPDSGHQVDREKCSTWKSKGNLKRLSCTGKNAGREIGRTTTCQETCNTSTTTGSK